MRRKDEQVTLIGEKDYPNRKEVVISGVLAVLLITATALSTSKSASSNVAATEKADESSAVATTTTTVITTEETSTVVPTSSDVEPTKKESTTTRAETKIEVSDSSSSPETTKVETTKKAVTTTAAANVKSPAIETYNAEANYLAETWVEKAPSVETTTTTTTTTTTETSEAKEEVETEISEKANETVEVESVEEVEETEETTNESNWDGPVLNSYAGIVSGPSGNETYYNLNMSGVVSNMQNLGYDYDYWVRDDGVKMYGDYVMCAADLSIRPKGTIVETSLGEGIVCDTGGFVNWDSTRLDIATTW
jgi:hypothetical protein